MWHAKPLTACSSEDSGAAVEVAEAPDSDGALPSGNVVAMSDHSTSSAMAAEEGSDCLCTSLTLGDNRQISCNFKTTTVRQWMAVAAQIAAEVVERLFPTRQ